MVCCAATSLSAVNRPVAEMLPEEVELTDQTTPTPEGRFRMENCLVPEGATVDVAGLTLVEASKVKLAVPRTASVEEFVAVTVRLCAAETLLGAVNTPLAEMLPTAEFSDHVTLVPVGKFTTENCWVPEGATVMVAGLTLVVGEACRFKAALRSEERRVGKECR